MHPCRTRSLAGRINSVLSGISSPPFPICEPDSRCKPKIMHILKGAASLFLDHSQAAYMKSQWWSAPIPGIWDNTIANLSIPFLQAEKIGSPR